jgi:hypothetical protein
MKKRMHASMVPLYQPVDPQLLLVQRPAKQTAVKSPQICSAGTIANRCRFHGKGAVARRFLNGACRG